MASEQAMLNLKRAGLTDEQIKVVDEYDNNESLTKTERLQMVSSTTFMYIITNRLSSIEKSLESLQETLTSIETTLDCR